MLKKLFLILGPLVLLVALVLAFGPREPVDETIRFDAAAIGDDPAAYLAGVESSVPNITPGAQKQIIWSDPASRSKTPISIVYLHGFSGTLEETRPVPDMIAKQLGANIFYTRLKGHGRDGAALAEATVNDWFNDTVEALAIGRAIGERVIVLGTSTGATFATWAASKPEMMKAIAGMAFISPNYGLNNPAAPILTLGSARYWIPVIFGHQRTFDTVNDEHAKWWTSSYPTTAVLPMAESVRFVNRLPFENITVPVLFVFHPEDSVVRPDITRDIAARWGTKTGAKASIFEVRTSEDQYNHVIAGRVLSPKNSAPVAAKITDWINSL